MYHTQCSFKEPVNILTPKAQKRKKETDVGDVNKRSKHKFFTPEKKLDILHLEAEGKSISRLAEEFGVGQQTIRDWKKNKAHIEKLVETNVTHTQKRRTTKGSNYPETEEALSLWFHQQRELNKPITRQLLVEKAKFFKSHLDKNIDKEFNASHGFIENFCARKGVKSFKSHDEKLSLDSKAVDPFIADLHLYVKSENLTINQLFNLDECGLLWKAFPGQTLFGPNETTASNESSLIEIISSLSSLNGSKSLRSAVNETKLNGPKDRITLGLCANASGTFKLPLIVIQKTAKPLCFNMNIFPVHYLKQPNACMDQELFFEWFHRKFVPAVEEYLDNIGLEKKAILLLNNCPAHPQELVSKSGLIKTKFLSPITTSHLQTIVQSPIAVLKKAYRTELLRDYLLKYENVSYDEFIKKINMNWVIQTLKDKWNAIPSSTFRNCWHNLKIGIVDQPNQIKDVSIDEIDKLSERLGLELEDVHKWLNCDKNVPGYEILTDNDIIAKVSNAITKDNEDDIDDSNDKLASTKEKPIPTINYIEVLRMIDSLQHWLDSNSQVTSQEHISLGCLRNFATRHFCLEKLKTTNMLPKS